VELNSPEELIHRKGLPVVIKLIRFGLGLPNCVLENDRINSDMKKILNDNHPKALF
jgi:hypothetical protein